LVSPLGYIDFHVIAEVCDLVHLSVPHLDRKEDHHESGKPDAACTEPENARTVSGEIVCACDKHELVMCMSEMMRQGI